MGSKSVRQKLNFDTMGELDHGSLRVAVNDALKLMTQDLHDRPGLDAKRKMTFTLTMAPKRDRNATTLDLEEVDLAWDIGLKVPGKGASGTVLTAQNDGMLAFVADVPDLDLVAGAAFRETVRAELAGKNLACFCPIGQACHADVLLKIANETPADGRS